MIRDLSFLTVCQLFHVILQPIQLHMTLFSPVSGTNNWAFLGFIFTLCLEEKRKLKTFFFFLSFNQFRARPCVLLQPTVYFREA